MRPGLPLLALLSLVPALAGAQLVADSTPDAPGDTALRPAHRLLGGWIGGSIVYVHGMRVLELVREPTVRAVAPVTPEKEAAAEGDAPPAGPTEPDR